MRVAIYIRVSTEEQAKEGYSVDAQKRKLLLYAEAQEWSLSGIYIDDGYSAKDLNRPEMQRLLKDVEKKQFDIVLTYKLDRLTRSVSDCDKLFQLFEKYNISYQSATESFETRTATGRMFIRMVAVLAQWERENTAERVRLGMEQKTLQGERVAIFPYGYTTDGTLIDEEVELIKELRNLFMSRFGGYRKIANYLNANGKLRRGKEWSDFTVYYTLENPLYYGLTRMVIHKDGVNTYWNKDDNYDCIYGDSIYPAIFTKRDYEKTKKEMARRRKGTGHSYKRQYWFAGVLKCGRCGAAMVGKAGSIKQLRTPFYICTTRNKGGLCNMPVIRQEHVEKLLKEFLSEIVLDEQKIAEKQQLILNKAKERESRIAEAKQAIAAIKNRRAKWQYMFANDLITHEELKERLSEESELLAHYESMLNEPIEDLREVKAAKTLLALWSEINDADKKSLINTVFKSITIYTDAVNPRVGRGNFYQATFKDVVFN